MIRKNNWVFEQKNTTDCEREFQIRRFFMQEYICYSFRKAHPPETLNFQAVTRSTFYQFVMYEIILNEKFRSANRVSVTSYGGHGRNIPYESRDYSAAFYLDGLSDPKANYLEVLSADFIVEKLEAPFDTGCTVCSESNCQRYMYLCKEECISTALAEHEKVSSIIQWFGDLVNTHKTKHATSLNPSKTKIPGPTVY